MVGNTVVRKYIVHKVPTGRKSRDYQGVETVGNRGRGECEWGWGVRC